MMFPSSPNPPRTRRTTSSISSISSPRQAPQSNGEQQHHQQHRDRSRLLLFFFHHHQRRKNLALFLGICVVYSYAFFQWQPDRSFEAMQRLNLELQTREQLRLEHRKAKKNGQDLDIVPEIADEAPDWQRKMRARAGDMAWRREQEQLAAAGHSNLRGGGDYFTDGSDEEEEEEAEDGKKKPKRRRRPQGSAGQAILDFAVMMSVFVITRTILRVCVLYRQFTRAQGGLSAAGLSLPTPTTTNNRRSTRNSGRGALARLVVPQSMHAHATLLRTARFRAWVTDLNRQRTANGQPPLSLESLRLVMRDSDFDGNDYEALMRFHEEATMAQSMGATQAEIDRCPQRVLNDPNDELLLSNNAAQACPICLEAYQMGDRVRRIHCFHEFHVGCIDPWLAHRAVCPVCKHPVVG
ncbi:Receptor homology region, transmembrane domain-and RING domain-containing protein [Seminavis robusta]|uniref:Receptor homology region, transmembrane domain-and RING domain-containing protein n=1 Tax=Seminavis robusta TaxID=568900 RepID=A0A9N8E5A4_9STRA|nr:Receptor homology region, transmembrane domain-and RING domain-containing protein [Seminavis robusta]|eukprot:Sro556_g165970.1 Receptor homology region, transmembrane domain- and RING domain-containing protein (409) ;mRNA; r:38781-40007